MTSKNVVESLLGTRQVGGRLSVLRFGKVFAVDKAGGAYSLSKIGWSDDRIEAVFEMAADGAEITVYLLERKPGVDGPFMTRYLVARHRGSELPPALSHGLELATRTWLAKATLHRLAGLLTDDRRLRSSVAANSAMSRGRGFPVSTNRAVPSASVN